MEALVLPDAVVHYATTYTFVDLYFRLSLNMAAELHYIIMVL